MGLTICIECFGVGKDWNFRKGLNCFVLPAPMLPAKHNFIVEESYCWRKSPKRRLILLKIYSEDLAVEAWVVQQFQFVNNGFPEAGIMPPLLETMQAAINC